MNKKLVIGIGGLFLTVVGILLVFAIVNAVLSLVFPNWVVGIADVLLSAVCLTVAILGWDESRE